MPFYPEEFFEATIGVVEGLVKAAGKEALVVMTVYSPFMWAAQLDTEADLAAHLQENPQAVSKGLEIMTENVLQLVRGCKRAGVDGFYVSTQGGEAFRFGARSSSGNTSSPPTWRSGRRSSPATSTSCTSATTKAGMPT